MQLPRKAHGAKIATPRVCDGQSGSRAKSCPPRLLGPPAAAVDLCPVESATFR